MSYTDDRIRTFIEEAQLRAAGSKPPRTTPAEAKRMLHQLMSERDAAKGEAAASGQLHATLKAADARIAAADGMLDNARYRHKRRCSDDPCSMCNALVDIRNALGTLDPEESMP